MLYTNRRSTAKIAVVIAALMCVSSKVTAHPHEHIGHQEPEQTLESKLAQKAVFIPPNMSAVDQLIEVAKHFKIPMGIEWVEQPSVEAAPLQLGSDGTVQQLINSILRVVAATQRDNATSFCSPLSTDVKSACRRGQPFYMKNR